MDCEATTRNKFYAFSLVNVQILRFASAKEKIVLAFKDSTLKYYMLNKLSQKKSQKAR